VLEDANTVVATFTVIGGAAEVQEEAASAEPSA